MKQTYTAPGWRPRQIARPPEKRSIHEQKIHEISNAIEHHKLDEKAITHHRNQSALNAQLLLPKLAEIGMLIEAGGGFMQGCWLSVDELRGWRNQFSRSYAHVSNAAPKYDAEIALARDRVVEHSMQLREVQRQHRRASRRRMPAPRILSRARTMRGSRRARVIARVAAKTATADPDGSSSDGPARRLISSSGGAA